MRPQVKKVVPQLLFVALVVISIVTVSQLVGRKNSSMLIDNGPKPTDDEDDDGLRFVPDDDESNVNTTIYADELSMAQPTYTPTYIPTYTLTNKTSPPKLTPPLSTTTTQPPSNSPTNSKPARFPSFLPSQTPNQPPIVMTGPDVDHIDDQSGSTSSLYHATNGCLKAGDTHLNTCVAAEHSSALTVHCCSGSQSSDNLTCRRNGCFETTSYHAAKDHCEREGMRLCTITELASGACCDKGCGFNSYISWAADVCEPTMSPTKAPTQSPTTHAGTLVNYSGGGDRTEGGDQSSSLGLVFEVQAMRDLAITSLSIFTESEETIWSEVWIRRGRYQGNTAGVAGWRRVYLKKSQQHGESAPLDIVFDSNVLIPEGQIMSFYLLSPGKIVSDRGDAEGNVIAEDNSLRLYTGAAIDNGRWEEGCQDGKDCIFPARTFNGAINYATSTMAPTSQPTPDQFIIQASGLTLREEQWLDEHNVRRKKWHEMYGKKYKPLEWSENLRDMAQAYADELASDCGATEHASYERRGGYGENLASNTGFDDGAGSWGELKPVTTVMSRFVERESTWAPPDNGHFTQVLWYATTHVGCADSTGTKPSGAVCRYQVCRYARAGNCNVKSFNDGSKEWWMKAVMQDSSNCQPFCPPGGC